MDDLISRQVAIEEFKKELTEGESHGNYVTICSALGFEGIRHILERLPSAQPENTSNNDCNGCKFIGCYDTDFPCANCIRRNKDYYASERRTDE